MSVLIKGMEMPKNCAVCRLEIDLFGRAVCFGYEDGRALYKDDLPPVGNKERRPDWCPLIELPQHGDLIDRDALIKSLDNLCDRVCQYSKAQRKVMCSACPLGDAFTVIEDDAPTVLEAEEGE